MVKVKCETEKGGAIELNQQHGVWASYAVTTVGDLPPAEILITGAKLPDGRVIQFFLNRQTGLMVVDVINRDGRGGREVLRRIA